MKSIYLELLNLFRTKLFKKYQRNSESLIDNIQTFYRKGMTLNEIVNYLSEAIGLDVSKETIRKSVNAALEEAEAFRKR